MTRLLSLTRSWIARLALGYVLVAVVFASAWLLSLYGPLTRAALDQQQRNLTAVAQAAALVAAQSDATPSEIAKQLVARTDLRLTIVAADGTVLADSNFDPAAMENHLDRPEVGVALGGGVGVDRRVSRTENRDELYVAVPASVAGDRVALRVSQPLAQIERIAERSRRMGLLLLGIAVVVAVGIAWMATREAMRPIGLLSDTAELMAEGNLSVAVPAVPSDLQDLADALASLRDQVSARIGALEAERVTLSATLDGLTDAVFLLEGDCIRVANRAAGGLFRAPADEWRNRPLAEAGLPAPVAAVIEEHRLARTPYAAELEPDPTGRVLRLVVVGLGGKPGAERSIVSVSDVTQRSRLDRVRREFVANASHELKTPVAGIRLLAQSVETAAADGDVEQAVAFAASIEEEARRLQHLVSDLLDLSRLESAPAADALCELRQAVGNAVLAHRGAATRKGLDLVQDFSAVHGADVYAAADPTDVAIALDNLLDNAIAYTTHGSVLVELAADETSVTLAVIDTGPGIALDQQPRVFERFYRIDAGRSRDAGGTGLGLALVKHVAERNGGSVRLVSEPGAGSRFAVTLRRAR